MRKIELDEHFTIGKILIYSLPAIFETYAITSFQMVDGYFVSTLLGITTFASIELISPVFFVLYAFGFMFGEGASALIAREMGRGNKKRGCEILSMTTVSILVFGTVTGIAAAVLVPQLSRLVGARPDHIAGCIEYGRMLLSFLPVYWINAAFISVWITAEKGWYGMIVSMINGLINVALDWFFMKPLNMGVRGAALATCLAAFVSASITILYFQRRNNRSSLRFVRFTLKDFRELFYICTNGASGMVDAVAGNVSNMMMNIRLLKYVGQLGVAAMGVYNYVEEFFTSVLFGICTTTITVAGFKCGEKKRDELDDLIKSNVILNLSFGFVLCLLFVVCAKPIAGLYLGYDAKAFELTVYAIHIMALSCIAYGFNLFSSSFFTGLGNGLVSVVISICGSLAAPLLMMFVIPALFGGEAIWFSKPAALLLTCFVSLCLLVTQYYRKKDEKLFL
ncbi:MAG: hypothetical protein K6F86_03420 [Lachnospiraceae bacterium]|nr:hypothetical protein [Lachnospiraceae bacterium]